MAGNALEIVFLTTYPPRRCGIATFSQDLVNAIQKITLNQVRIKVAALEDPFSPIKKYPKEVEWTICQEKVEDYKDVAEKINARKSVACVVVQHEYGIFGGMFGKNLLEFLKHIRKPIIAVLHTILTKPQEEVRCLTQEIIDRADKVIVMTQDSKRILLKNYQNVSSKKVYIIPHGIHPVVFQESGFVKEHLGFSGKILALSFGLLNPNKGIEYVIQALPQVIAHHPNLLYVVLGATHPVVKQSQGESYRKFLMKKVSDLGIKNNVRFINRYLSLRKLLSFIQASDVCVICNLAHDQSVSGTLSYALGSGRAVNTTGFRQAKYLVKKDVGRLVKP